MNQFRLSESSSFSISYGINNTNFVQLTNSKNLSNAISQNERNVVEIGSSHYHSPPNDRTNRGHGIGYTLCSGLRCQPVEIANSLCHREQ